MRQPICCAVTIAAVVLGAVEACADERSASVVGAFQATCASELPNFARLDTKAAAEDMPVNSDAGTPRREGYFHHIKSWVGGLDTGLYVLIAVETRGPLGEVTTCAMVTTDGPGEDAKQDLMRAFDIGPPERENVTPDGMRHSAWYIQVQGERVILLMVDATPINKPGIYLNITYGPVAGP